MKALWIAGFLLLAPSYAAAAGCITTPRGETVCRDASGAIVAAPAPRVVVAPGAVGVVPHAAVVTGPAYGTGMTVQQGAATSRAVYNSNTGVATTSQHYAGGVTTAQNSNGSKAAYNPHTGNAAVQTTNSNGVKTTNTRYGGEAKTKNGMGVAQGPGGKTCARGRGEAKCN
jgi:hypothetical protein